MSEYVHLKLTNLGMCFVCKILLYWITQLRQQQTTGWTTLWRICGIGCSDFFCTTIPSFWIFFIEGGGGSTSFSSNWKKITLLLILQFLMKNLLKTIKNKQRYIITGEVKLRFVMRNRLKRGWYAQQFTYLQRNNFLYFSCKKLSSDWKLEKNW